MEYHANLEFGVECTIGALWTTWTFADEDPTVPALLMEYTVVPCLTLRLQLQQCASFEVDNYLLRAAYQKLRCTILPYLSGS